MDDLLHTRDMEYEVLLQRAREVLQADQRVVAAWLFGSRGRQTPDVLSDTDLWVVVEDEQIETFCKERQRYVSQLGEPVLLLEAARNAPARGAYLMALYAGRAGVHQVDWYWQRRSDASLPRHAELLFDRGGIRQDSREEQPDPAGTPQALTQPERAEQATQLSSYFWVMSNIAVKCVLRHQAWLAVSMLEMLKGLVDEMKRLVGLSMIRKGREEWRTNMLPPVAPREQIAMLRETARDMEGLTPEIEAAGGHVQAAAIPYVYDFFDLADAMLTQQENRLRDKSS
jgi:predicted nucleotidyltransferase